jgi:EmrB/QacA subfamily drug resistance transporter
MTTTSHSGAPPPAGEQARPSGSARWVLVATICASSLAFIDGSVVNVALPSIGRSLQASAAELQWTVNAYLLPLSALLLLGGAAGDHFGRKRLLIGGTALFALASLVCLAAPSLDLLLVGRALQGVGAAMLMPNSLAILGNAFTGEARGKAIGTWASAGAIASAVGPPLGGWLVETAGWRAIFLINLPLAIAAMRQVEESAEGEQPLDWIGALVATGSLGTLTWALTVWSSRKSLDAAAGLTGAIGLALLAAFVVIERHRGERAMVPLRLFRSKPFVGLSALTLLLYGALGGLLVLLPYVLIVDGGYSPLQAGLALLPFSIVIGTASRLAGRLTERVGPRWPLTIGPLITALGFGVMTLLDPQKGYWLHVLPGMAVIATGMAGAVAPLTTAVLSSVDARHTGTASGLNSAIARTGGLIATALTGAVIVQTGAALVSAFHAAALVGAVLAAASGMIAFMTLGSKTEPTETKPASI